MHRQSLVFSVLLLLVLALVVPTTGMAVPTTLKGSPDSMLRQNRIAKTHEYLFAETAEEIQKQVDQGTLVPVISNADLEVLASVSYPYARPEVRLFLERLAAQYHEGTGERLVVTSLMRPSSKQPRNAHKLSVHPTGMAIDLRVSSRQKSRAWLESVLLKLERQSLLDVTRERYPPHYHIALFPDAYRDHVEELIGPQALAMALLWQTPAEEPEADAADTTVTPQVRVTEVEPRTHEHALPVALPLLVFIIAGLGYRMLKQQRAAALAASDHA